MIQQCLNVLKKWRSLYSKTLAEQPTRTVIRRNVDVCVRIIAVNLLVGYQKQLILSCFIQDNRNISV